MSASSFLVRKRRFSGLRSDVVLSSEPFQQGGQEGDTSVNDSAIVDVLDSLEDGPDERGSIAMGNERDV